MRIVHCFRAPMGGVFRHVRDLAEAQAEMGHQVGLVCDASSSGAHEESLFEEINRELALGVTRIPMQRTVGLGDAAAAWRAFRAVKALKPNVIHGHGAKGGVYARLFGTLLGRQVGRFYSPHGGSLHFDPASAKGKAVFAVERQMERLTDGLFFVCEFEKRTYEAKIGPVKTPTRVVYNGLRDAEFEPVRLVENPADILFIGEMRQLKGPDLLLEAIALAEKRIGRQIRAVFVGNGAEAEAFKGLAGRLGLGERVVFEPAQPARQAFAKARLVVMPSRAEAFPYIVLEALSAGLPMIASRVGGIPEIFGDQSAALVEPDATAIAGKLAEALDDLDRYRSRTPATDDLRARFSARTMAREITDAYRQAARHG